MSRPLFSIVSAVYGVAGYLPQFIDSVDAQTLAAGDLEVVMVDDGSTDGSAEILQQWARRRPDLVTVVRKENGGQASARNVGIDTARGEWVTFIDPDDWVTPNYFSDVADFVAKHPSTAMVAVRRRIVNERTGRESNHPLNDHFDKSNRLRNLEHETAHFHGHAPSAFFRLDEVRRQGRYFDAAIAPTFEDGSFSSWYLLDAPAPIVGFVRSASYMYRKRAEATSTLDKSWTDPRRWELVPRIGFLPLLVEAKRRYGVVPSWLQTMMIYELNWYLRVVDAVPAVETAAHGDVARNFYETLGELVRYLDPHLIATYPSKRLTSLHRDVLLHSFIDAPWHSPSLIVDRVDTLQGTMRARLRFTGPEPATDFYVGGAMVEPIWRKIRDVVYFGRVAVCELIVWLPIGTLRAVVADRDVEVRVNEPDPALGALSGARIRRELAPKPAGSESGPVPGMRDALVLRLSRSRFVNKVFRRAWVMQDRVHDADDSAEHLFAYLREHQRAVNAWFVLAKSSPDWPRLRRVAGRRLVAHGSLRWKLLMLNCRHLVSSHADVAVMDPPQLRVFAEHVRWRRTFLQHGVTKDDLSGWLNPKDFDLFVTSTPDEYRSVAGDHNSYRYTPREVISSGLPRFDLIRAAGQRFPPDRRDLLLIAPTWRRWLAVDDPATGKRVIDVKAFTRSQFAIQWRNVLASPEIEQMAAAHGLTVAVLLHPDLQRVTDDFDLPAHVVKLSFYGTDVKEIFGRARVFATDYSSMFFNAAYIDRPIVYFQFDRERVLGGGHLGRPGYFDYERNGFGPVTYDSDAAVTAIVDAVESGPGPAARYQRRIDSAFPLRDGGCTRRTYEAIENSTKPVATESASASVSRAGDLLLASFAEPAS